MKVGPKSSRRPFLHRALHLMRCKTIFTVMFCFAAG